MLQMSVPVAAQSKEQMCRRLPDETVGSNPGGCMDMLSVVSVVCCHVEISVVS
jgi:hypothetical protein